MFVDEKRQGEARTKADPFTLESLIAWLEKQPANGCYYVFPTEECLLGQFAKAMGCDDAASKSWELGNQSHFARVAFEFPEDAQTFGSALARAKALT